MVSVSQKLHRSKQNLLRKNVPNVSQQQKLPEACLIGASLTFALFFFLTGAGFGFCFFFGETTALVSARRGHSSAALVAVTISSISRL